ATERAAPQAADGLGGAYVHEETVHRLLIGDVAPHAAVHPADLVERAARGEHADHARLDRVDVGQQDQWAWRGRSSQHREVRERPHGIVEDRDVRARFGDEAGLAGGQLVRRDELRRPDDLVTGVLQRLDDGVLRRLGPGLDVAVDEVSPVRDGEQADPCHGQLLSFACSTQHALLQCREIDYWHARGGGGAVSTGLSGRRRGRTPRGEMAHHHAYTGGEAADSMLNMIISGRCGGRIRGKSITGTLECPRTDIGNGAPSTRPTRPERAMDRGTTWRPSMTWRGWPACRPPRYRGCSTGT